MFHAFTSRPWHAERCLVFPLKTTASGLNPNMLNRYSVSLNVCTPMTNTRARASVSPSARKSFSVMAAEFGSNQDQDMAPLSTSLFPLDESADRQALRPGPILLVEDNSGDVILVREALLEHHVPNDLRILTDGQKAIELLDSIHAGNQPECPALLILDLNLPRKTGREVLAHMRRIPRCDDIPVLVLSSSNAPADRQSALDLGARLYIRKPSDLVDFMQIGAAIRQILAVEPPPS